MIEPMPLQSLLERVAEGEECMTDEERRLWELVRVPPSRWKLEPWGDETGGFWVVGWIGRTVIWFNEIEDGFNSSRFSEFGRIDEYYCNQDEMNHVICQLRCWVEWARSSQKLGAPEPIDRIPIF